MDTPLCLIIRLTQSIKHQLQASGLQTAAWFLVKGAFALFVSTFFLVRFLFVPSSMPNLVGPVSFGPLKPISVVPKEKVNCMVLENCLDPRPKKRREGERERKFKNVL